MEINTEKRILKINGEQIEEPTVVSTPALDGWQNSFLFNYEKLESGQYKTLAKRLAISLENNDTKEEKPLQHTSLKDASTKDLVAELERREGVEKRWLEPGKETIPQVSSPTILLIVTD